VGAKEVKGRPFPERELNESPVDRREGREIVYREGIEV
jgi:hypothetical protein